MTTLPSVHPWLQLDPKALRHRFLAGDDVSPERLAGFAYNGHSLGQPDWVAKLTWRRFRKVIINDNGHLRGWNEACYQDPEDSPFRVKTKGDLPQHYGHYLVGHGKHLTGPWRSETLLDYRACSTLPFHPMRRIVDPLRQVDEHTYLGLSLLRLGGRTLYTPSWFLLQRGEPVTHPLPLRGRA